MNKRILLVDCSPKLRQATRDKLEASGLSVSVATTGEDVAAALRDERYDLIVLEPVIPGLDGFKFCQGLKRDEGASAPPVILASRIFRGGRLKTMSRDAGADAHFERPQQDAQLYACIEQILATTGPVGGTAMAQPADDDRASLDEVVELSTDGSLEDEDSLTAMVPEPSLGALDEPALDAADSAPEPEPPRFEDLGAPLSAPQPAEPAVEPIAAAPPRAASAPASPPAQEPGAGRSSDQEDEDSGLQAISEEDIEDALARALGTEDGSSDLGGTVFPDDLATGLGAESSPGGARRAVDSPVAFLEDVDPQASPPPNRSAPAEESLPALDGDDGFALLDLDDGEDEASRPRRATAAPQAPAAPEADQVSRAPAAAERQKRTQEDAPSTGEAGVDPDGDSLVRAPEQLDALLERAFGGQSGPPSSSEESAGEKRGPAEESPPPVPESLQGMDASTADLLSSLAELETSIPGAQSGQAWDLPTPEPGDPDPSLPVPPPPSPEDELTLEEIFSRVSSEEKASERESSQRVVEQPPEPGTPAQVEEGVAVSKGGESKTGRARKGWKKWFLGSIAVAALGAGGAGAYLMQQGAFEGLGRSGAPAVEAQNAASTQDAAPATASRRDQAPAEDPAEQSLSTLRRSIDLSLAPDTEAGSADSPAEAPAQEATDAPPVQRAEPRLTAERRPEPERVQPARQEAARPFEALQVVPPRQETTNEPREAKESSGQAADTSEAGEEGSQEVLLVPLGDLDEPLARLDAPAPFPTQAAFDAGVRVRAFINVLVGPDGSVKTARTMMDPGYGLGEVARQATLGWRYSVPLYNGNPAEVWKTEAVEFDATSP